MAQCDVCGEFENMPYKCRYCGGTYCGDHRLPENHDCPGLNTWNDPGGVFDSGFDDSIGGETGRSESAGVLARLGLDTGPGSVFGYFRGNLTYLFLALMWVTWFLQWAVAPAFGIPAGSSTWNALFVISSENPFYVWTWITSIFAHAPSFYHIVGNSIVIYFFGRLVEEYVGSRNYGLLFLGSGTLAGLGQLLVFAVQGVPGSAYGASGAGLAIMGVLTVLNPGLRVYLYFLIPVPIWAITGFYAILSVMGILGSVGAGIANGAHLVGLLIGLAYGEYVSRQGVRAPGQLQFGGGRGPGGPGGPGRGRF